MINRDRYDQISDCVFEVLGKVVVMSEVHYIIEHLPREVKLMAEQWGWNDTEVANMTFRWIRDNKESIVTQFNK